MRSNHALYAARFDHAGEPGLALNLLLWSVPSLFASSDALHYALGGLQPRLAARVTNHPSAASSNPHDALVHLIDAGRGHAPR